MKSILDTVDDEQNRIDVVFTVSKVNILEATAVEVSEGSDVRPESRISASCKPLPSVVDAFARQNFRRSFSSGYISISVDSLSSSNSSNSGNSLSSGIRWSFGNCSS